MLFLLVGTLFGYLSRQMMIEEIFSHLQTTVETRKGHVKDYIDLNIDRMSLISSRTKLRNTLKDYNENSNQDSIPIMRDILNDAIASTPDFQNISIFDNQGKIIVSVDENLEGSEINNKEKILKNVSGPNVVIAKGPSKELSLYIFGPIILDEEKIGNTLIKMNASNFYSVLSSRAGLGKSGETYLVDDNLNLISPALFLDESKILDEKIDTQNSRLCFSEHAGDNHGRADNNSLKDGHMGHESVQIFPDYRGEQIIGTHAYISDLDWCLLAEIDEKEALLPIKNLLWIFVLTGGGSLIIFFLITIFIARTISRPIEKLHYGTEIIEKGDLNYRIGIEREDEIGQLSRSFDKMTAAIKKSRADVDKQVKEQVREIREKAKFLTQQRKAILNILEDVETEKNKTENEKKKIDAILHSIGDAVFAVDKKMNIIMFNKIASEITGFSQEEAMGSYYKKILNFVFEENKKNNDEFIKEAMNTGEIQEMNKQTLLIDREGRKIPVADSASPLKNDKGDIVGCVVVFRDVTKEREIDKAKTEFVSLASHQLRTPLSSINWYCEMLLSGDAGNLNAEQKDFLEEIYTGNQRMVDLVNALLNVSRIELGTLAVDPKPINFNKVAKSVLKEIEPMAKERKHQMKAVLDKKLTEINADPNLVRMIFQNLLSNAVKYTPTKGEITIETKKEGEYVIIKVIDNGYGIPKNQQAKIFSKLFRANNVQEKDAEGTGLGLYIIRSIVKNAGGRIWFESKENKGTTFFVSFPLSGMKKKEGSRGLTEVK